MKEIGLIDFTNNEEIFLTEIIQVSKYKIIRIPNKKEDFKLSKRLDVIVLNGNDSSDFLTICEWLAFLKSYTSAYFIVTLGNEDKNERLVYLQLGAMQVINLNTQSSEIPILLKNYHEKLSSQKNSHKSLELNSANRTLVVDGNKEVELTRLEYKIMNCLSNNIGTTVSYKELISYVWGQDSSASKIQLSNLIFSLRGKLDPKDRGLVKTIRSKGYMLADRPQDNL
ncbi:hypothetical protein BCR24_15055 [Enterococcus ureilyticus]|uniref:OmpR/PhoB-type domain-containing protein n=1 Tax=Enterococcus ureilyticus TaxID=1131292 RepID=A0A1E5HCH1_9ENTE|nr:MULTISPECIES: winged helix-turn-helix domain-containing protein [Enterococcus]MBM7690432.1 DNA-binding response OmpR family regulator [Enterococcus ureilyticus]MBO0473624.1 winged-helix domain-containing protein [Enterococcus ureasiticus]OEG22526.1 hypothetical protein BCR24_15055 [Enterococcus ureilyticus]